MSRQPSRTTLGIMATASFRVRAAAPRRPSVPSEEFIGSDAFVPAALDAFAEAVRKVGSEDKRRRKGARRPE
jgi:hypothetical protein